MASVFLARDTRDATAVGALKVVPSSARTKEAREILESEQRGAELQQRFSAVSPFVPKVFESGFTDDYFYIAMEYIDGEDLSQAIHRGTAAVDSARSRSRCSSASSSKKWIASTPARDVAARAAAQRSEAAEHPARRERRRDQGARLRRGQGAVAQPQGHAQRLRQHGVSVAGVSRQRRSRPAVGRLGARRAALRDGARPAAVPRRRHAPARAADPLAAARRNRIDGDCPPALQAVIAKLLAPYPADRYGSPAEIHADLARAQAGRGHAALAEGWLDEHDDAPTRRTDDEPSRRAPAPGDEPPTRRTRRPEAADLRRNQPFRVAPVAATGVVAPAPRRSVAFRALLLPPGHRLS